MCDSFTFIVEISERGTLLPPVKRLGRMASRRMGMSSLYICGKPCSTGTHNETVKIWPYFLHSINRIMIKRLLQLCSAVTPQKENAIKAMLSRHLINETWYKSEEGSSLKPLNAKWVSQRYTFHVLKTETNQNNLQQPAAATSFKV